MSRGKTSSEASGGVRLPIQGPLTRTEHPRWPGTCGSSFSGHWSEVIDSRTVTPAPGQHTERLGAVRPEVPSLASPSSGGTSCPPHA